MEVVVRKMERANDVCVCVCVAVSLGSLGSGGKAEGLAGGGTME